MLGCPCRWSKKSAGVVFRERDSSHPLPFGLSLSKPFTSFERKVEPFDRLRANGGGDGALRQADRGLEGGFQSLRDRKSTRLNSVTNAHLVCRLLLEKKKQ